jgi:hypothetical protein
VKNLISHFYLNFLRRIIMRRIYLVCTFLVLGLWLSGTVAVAQNQIRNWEFDEPLVVGVDGHWWMWESANFTGLSIVQGAALSGENAMQVAIPDGAAGSLQVYHSFLELEQGVTYTISFMARADAPRTITVRLMGRTLYNWQTFWSQSEIQLTAEPQTYTFEYQHTGETVGGTGVFNDDIDWCFDHAGSDIDAYYDHIWLGEGPPPSPSATVSAYNPNPADGAIYPDTWATLTWTPGDTAVSHDVYFGENFADVNDGTNNTFQGNESSPFFVVGFPGFVYPDGLVPGTTYYWRIDEVNNADPNSPWKGTVWSFSVPFRKAHKPYPYDGANFVATDVILSWAAGLDAKIRTLYFGQSFEDVNNAKGNTNKGQLNTTSFDPGILAPETTYYWRVDEFDGAVTRTGDVWIFTTTRPGLGTAIAERWNNIGSTDLNTLKNDPRYPNNPDVTETVTEFSWNGPDTDDYGGRIEAWIYAPGTGDYTFWLNTDDQGELWLSTDDDSSNAVLVALESSWADLNAWGSGEEQSDPIPLTGGERYYIMALWKEAGGGDHCQVAWQGPGIPDRIIIAGTYLSPYEPLTAYGAKPGNLTTGVTQTPTLEWKPGLQAASHEVYFGTDADALANATKASPEYKGARTLGEESFVPGQLAWESTYYWRIDEVNDVNPDSPWKGSVWSFTTADFLIVDDFESYDAYDNQIWWTWKDGLGYGTPGTDPYYAGNGTGSAVGDENTSSYTEETIVHGGSQAMPLFYDNNKQGFFKYSEAEMTLTSNRDWTVNGVNRLTIWFRGDSANAAETLYVVLNGNAVVSHDNPDAAQVTTWTQWNIDLQAFADQGINLANVNSIILGLGNRNNPVAGGSGTMYFDDIRLYPPPPEPAP